MSRDSPTVITVDHRSGLFQFLLDALKAYNDRTEAWAKSDNSEVLNVINNLSRKVDTFMATQEERLQAILTAVKTVKQMLADLKANNPAIEDEISAIEGELEIAPAAEPAPTPVPEG